MIYGGVILVTWNKESIDHRHRYDRNYLSTGGINRLHRFTDGQLSVKLFDIY